MFLNDVNDAKGKTAKTSKIQSVLQNFLKNLRKVPIRNYVSNFAAERVLATNDSLLKVIEIRPSSFRPQIWINNPTDFANDFEVH